MRWSRENTIEEEWRKWNIQIRSVSQSCPTLCDPMSMPGLPVHQQLPESTQNHVHCVSDAIQPSHPLLSPSSPALNLSQHLGLFRWVTSCVVGRGCLLWPVCSLGKTLLASALLYFVLRGQTCLLLQVSLNFLLLHPNPLWWKGHLFVVVVVSSRRSCRSSCCCCCC